MYQLLVVGGIMVLTETRVAAKSYLIVRWQTSDCSVLENPLLCLNLVIDSFGVVHMDRNTNVRVYVVVLKLIDSRKLWNLSSCTANYSLLQTRFWPHVSSVTCLAVSPSNTWRLAYLIRRCYPEIALTVQMSFYRYKFKTDKCTRLWYSRQHLHAPAL